MASEKLHNQQSPGIGGPWQQNVYSGINPPWGVEWDAPLPGTGIMPGQAGVFSYCTYEREREVNEAGWAHTWGFPLPEPIIDLDGTLTPGVGGPPDRQVFIGAPLTGWPTGFDVEGIDWFDNDSSLTWTLGLAGDDLHVEGAAYPTASREGRHDNNPLFVDPVVLDLDGSLLNGQPVNVDLESGTIDPSGSGVVGAMDPRMKFYDANLVTNWDDGEDIVLDLNLDGVFGEIINAQTFIFHGPNSMPGRLFHELGIVESPGHEIAKKAKYMDDDGDGSIEVGEPVRFLVVIQVHNPTGNTWTDVVVEDRLGAELENTPVPVPNPNPSQGTAVVSEHGKTGKLSLKWNIGTLGPGETAVLALHVTTDLNPAGKQEYTSPGTYEFNSGAVLKFLVDSTKVSAETGSIMVTVVP